LRGWRYADKKDVAKKLSPYLVPWKQLSPEIQQYDVDAICSLPAKLRGAGLEVFPKQ
jgi:ABC-type amino acid transport substrate-binding protein